MVLANKQQKCNLPKFLVCNVNEQIEVLLMLVKPKLARNFGLSCKLKNEVLLIYGKITQKVNLTAIVIHNIAKNTKVLLMIGKLPKNVICSNFGQKNKQKAEVLLMFGKTAQKM